MDMQDKSLYEIKARIIAVLANPKRLEIVDLLSGRERAVSDVSRDLGLAQATTSQHLAIMRKAGVLEKRKEGNRVYYRLADPKIAAACGVMSEAVVDLLAGQQERMRPVLALARDRSARS